MRTELPRRRAIAAALGMAAALPTRLRAADAAPHAEAPDAEGDSTLTTSDGVRLHLIERRPQGAPVAGAPTLVFVPGWCMPASIWSPQIDSLGARWPVCAFDPRGQGASEVPATGYTLDRRADDLHELLARRQRVVLVAWSLAVLEALHYVQRHGSGRLLGLVLVDNSIGEPPPPGPSDFVARLQRARVATVEEFVRVIFARPRPPAELQALRDQALRMPLEASVALLNYPKPRTYWRDAVHAFDRPLAYVVTPRYRGQAQNLLRARPNVRVEIFEKEGHALFVDEAARFNTLLAGWVSGIAAG